MDVLNRLHQLLQARGWSEYRLARKSGLSESTISNIYRRNTLPSVATLEAICDAFGITLSEFFADGEMAELTPEVRELLEGWALLTPEQKKVVLAVIRSYRDG